MKDVVQLGLASALLSAAAWAGTVAPVPSLPAEHVHSSGAFSFRTPPGWKVETHGVGPEIVDAAGDGLIVRFLFRPDEPGYDSLHATCMLERLPGTSDPRVKYDYDYLEGKVGEMRSLDSAFDIRYDQPVMGYRDWRQRNLTLVGEGRSLCAITYCPLPLWKKSPETRALLKGILASLTLRPWP
jgi:hypothetical protein